MSHRPEKEAAGRRESPLRVDVEAEVERLAKSIARLREEVGGKPERFESFERDLHSEVMALERQVLAETMEDLDIDAEAIVIEGRNYRRVLKCKQSYMTAAGSVEVARTLYKDRSHDEERAVCALDRRLGIVGGFWTPLAGRQGLWVVTQMTPGKGEELFSRIGNMQPSKSSLDRLPKELSERWEQDRLKHEEALREATVIPEGATTLAISIDGVLAPMANGGARQKRDATAAKGQLTRGAAGFREFGCATLSFCNDDGEMLGAVRMARAPEEKKVTLKQQLHDEVIVALAKNPELRLVKIADGFDDNWNYLSQLVGESPQIVDFYHACEHLNAAIAAAYGDGTVKARLRFDELREQLKCRSDGVQFIIRTLRRLYKDHPKEERLRLAIGYFRKHRHRMAYSEFLEEGFPIGSGVVEAACKSLVSQRLKNSGMRWSDTGAQAILTPRGWAQSQRFDAAWALLAATYQSEVTVLANVVPMRRRSGRAASE